ncbi:MAG: ribonuclease J, partial [Rhodobiaceae bacterium]|nr:ribonuclease J [Rhodobiaceae bacterium]
GMNLYLYGHGPADRRRWLIVDLGVTFANNTLPGIDLIVPDISFLEAERENIDGILLTHGHEDHLGAVLSLWPRLKVPVYATPFTAGLLEAKREEDGAARAMKITELALSSRFMIGSFDLELVTVAHSIPEPNAVVWHSPIGKIVHSGDWKLDPDPVIGAPTNMDRFAELGREGVHAFICDSTNAMREGISPSEGEVREALFDIVKAEKNRVAVTIFASNLARLKSVTDAGYAAGREVVAVGRAMHRIIAVARDTGYLDDGYVFRGEDEFGYLPRDKVLLLCTGSQGESRAAMARIAREDHPRITLAPGDLAIFSSRTIPGNEREVGLVQNRLVQRGVRILTDADAMVHVSGHPRRDELRQMYGLLKPKIAIPMHGEARHMKAHADLARELGVPHVVNVFNGDMIALNAEPPVKCDELPNGRWYLDGNVIIPAADTGVKERRRLSETGIVFVSLAIDHKGNVVDGPEVSVYGLPGEPNGGDDYVEAAMTAAEAVISGTPRARLRNPDLTAEAVRRAVIAAVRDLWGKKPQCDVHVASV